MSQVYSTEPQTAGRVIFETTHGPLEMQLWCRECPGTTRFFLQLCLDGFYDGMAFHRIMPNFLVQTGAIRPHKSKKNKDGSTPQDMQVYRRKTHADEALGRRSYELNSRIRFNHRGQVAMALEVNDNDNTNVDDLPTIQPQFFITLDEASHLDGKHVCFGTITGPTIFNALRIGQTDVDEATHQPVILAEAPRIERVKIVENPIHNDIVPTAVIPWHIKAKEEESSKNKKKKRKGVKNVNVLSFGDEMEDIERDSGGGGIKSSHDVIQSKVLSKEVDDNLKKSISADVGSKGKPKQKASKEIVISKDTPSDQAEIQSSSPKEQEQQEPDNDSKPPEMAPVFSKKQHKSHQADNNDHAIITKKKEAPPKKVSLVEARRAKYAKKGAKDKRKREMDTMKRLMAFQTKLTTTTTTVAVSSENAAALEQNDDAIAARLARRAAEEEQSKDHHGAEEVPKDEAESYHGQVLEDDEPDDIKTDWMKTKFKCRKHMDHDAQLGGDGRSAKDDYEVVDEKGRNQNNQTGQQHRHHHKRHKPHHHHSGKGRHGS